MTRARNSANLASDGNLFVNISDDRTGIGSLSPTHKLHVAGTSFFDDDVLFRGANTGRNCSWDKSTRSLVFDGNSSVNGNYARARFNSSGSYSMDVYNNLNNFVEVSPNVALFVKTCDLQVSGSGSRGGTTYDNAILRARTGIVELGHEIGNGGASGYKLATAAYGVNVTGTTDTDGLIVSGVATVTTMNVTGVLTYDDVTSVDSIGIVTARAGVSVTGGDLTINTASPTLNFTETNGDPDYRMFVNGGIFTLKDTTNDIDRFSVTSSRITLNDTVLVNDSILYIHDKIVHWGDDNTAIRFPSDDTIQLETGGSNRLVINSSGNATFSGNLTVSGNLSVTGTTTQNNSVSTSQKTITLASGAANNAAVDGAGIVVDAGSDTDKTLKWLDSTDRWTFTGGDVSANAFYGDGSNLTGLNVAINTLTNASDNRVLTSSGGSTVNAESALLFNGYELTFNVSGSQIILRGAGVTKHELLAHSGNNDLTFVNNRDSGNITSNIVFKGSGTGGETVKERLRLTSSGALFGGTGVSQTNRQLVVGSNSEANLAIETHNTSASETANIRFYRSRGTAASPTTLVDGDIISQLFFYGHDGTDYSNTAARIRVHCSSTVANNSVPSSLTFSTFRASTTLCTEALRLTHMQDLTMGNGSGYSIWRGSANDQFCRYQFRQTTGDNRGFAILEERGDSNCVDLFISKSRGGSGKGVITSGDNLGTIKFTGADGTRQHNGAGLVAWTSGTIATGRIPTNLSFYTHPDSAGQWVERLRIQSVGRILFGNHKNDRGAELQYEGSEHAGIGIHRNTSNHGAPAMVFSASRGTSAGSNTIVQNNDYLGLIRFAGTDGTSSLAAGALITGIVDGTPGSDDMPGRLQFWTSADGSDSPTERLRITQSGKIGVNYGGTPPSETFMIRPASDESVSRLTLSHLSSGNSYGARISTIGGSSKGFDLATQFNSSYITRARMTDRGVIQLSPSDDISSVNNSFVFNIGTEYSVNHPVYAGLTMRNLETGGSNGFAIHTTSSQWDLYNNSGSRYGLSIAHNTNASSGNSRFYLTHDGYLTVGSNVNARLSTSRKGHTRLHVVNGGVSVGPQGNTSNTQEGGRYVLGWYMVTHNTSNSYTHLITDLWAGGSPHGNSEYIMGGFHIHGHQYAGGASVSRERIYFHNWSGSYPGYSNSNPGNWSAGSTVYTNSSGYVTLRLIGGSYRGFVIDLIQHAWYPSRDITVTTVTQSTSSTL